MVVLPFLQGFAAIYLEWHMSKDIQKSNDQLQKEFTLKRTTNGKLAARRHVSRFLLASRKGETTLRLPSLFILLELVILGINKHD